MLALAHHWRDLIRARVVKDQADLARLVGVSRARVTQVMDLLYLARDLQEEILLAKDNYIHTVRHRDLLPLAARPDWNVQRRMWTMLEVRRSAPASPGLGFPRKAHVQD
jgi:hypothetical protein